MKKMKMRKQVFLTINHKLKAMKKLLLKPNFVLLLAEITLLCELKPNAPETELTSVEKRNVGNIYYKYFGSLPISKFLMDNEYAIKWPDNSRKKTHECQRAILGVLHKINAYFPVEGELIPRPETPLDLTWVMDFLNRATANDIAILQMVTDVVNVVPVIHTPATIHINGKRFVVSAGSMSLTKLLEIYNEKYVPIDATLVTGLSWQKGDGKGDMELDAEVNVAESGWYFTILSGE